MQSLEDQIKHVGDLVIANNEAIRTASAPKCSIQTIAAQVRTIINSPNAETPKIFYAYMSKSISCYMKANFADPLLAVKDNSRELFGCAASFAKPINSIESAVRFTFLALDAIMKRMGVHTVANLPFGSLSSDLINLRPLLFGALVAQMNVMRDGGNVTRDSVRSVAELIRKINMHLDLPTKSVKEERKFVSDYCKSVEVYYGLAGKNKLEACCDNIVIYANWAGRRINEERELLTELSMSKEWDKLKLALTNALVRSNFVQVIHEEEGGLAKEMNAGNDVSDLFALLELVQSDKDPLEGVKQVGTAYQSYILKRAREILSAPEPPLEPVPDGQKPKPRPNHSVVVYNELMELCKNQLLTVWPTQFKSNPVILNNFERALTPALKENPDVPRNHSNYCSDVMKKFKEDVLNDDVQQVLFFLTKVFECITQKDEFIPSYRGLLASRLLRPNFCRTIEGQFIAAIKTIIGRSEVYHLECMIHDIDNSASSTKEFLELYTHQFDNSKIKLHFTPISRQHWPNFSPVKVQIPEMIEKFAKQFEMYYFRKYPTRKIDWLCDRSSASVNVAFTAGPKELNGSLQQIIVLLALDGSAETSIDSLASKTGMATQTTTDLVASMVLSQVKALKPVRPVMVNGRPRLKGEDCFALNDGFKAPVRKIDLVPAQASKRPQESESNQVNNQRKTKTQIAIVRFMKSRGNSPYTQMLEAVLRDLRRTFDAQAPGVKTELDELIDKGFVRRDENDRSMLVYIA